MVGPSFLLEGIDGQLDTVVLSMIPRFSRFIG